MKRPTAIAIGILAALVIAAPASAGPPYQGRTVLLNPPPTSGETLLVDASISSATPVVAYEYAIQNECAFPNRTGSSYQRDDIVYWTAQTADGLPHATLPVYLQSVPAGSKCKVFLVRGNVVVKGSTTSYTVQ